jgi:hypothetical protein
MKVTIRSLGGAFIRDYKEMLEKKLDYKAHYNVYMSKWLNNQEYKLDELKDVEINSIEELYKIFNEFEGFSYPDCQIAIDVKSNIVYIFDTWVE